MAKTTKLSAKCLNGQHAFDAAGACKRKGCPATQTASLFGYDPDADVEARRREASSGQGELFHGEQNPATGAVYPPSVYLRNPFFSPPAVSYTIWKYRPGAYAQNPRDGRWDGAPWQGNYGEDQWRSGGFANPPPWVGEYGEGGWRPGPVANPPSYDPELPWVGQQGEGGWRGPGYVANPGGAPWQGEYGEGGWRPGPVANPCHEWGGPGMPPVDFTPRGGNPKPRRVRPVKPKLGRGSSCTRLVGRGFCGEPATEVVGAATLCRKCADELYPTRERNPRKSKKTKLVVTRKSTSKVVTTKRLANPTKRKDLATVRQAVLVAREMRRRGYSLDDIRRVLGAKVVHAAFQRTKKYVVRRKR